MGATNKSAEVINWITNLQPIKKVVDFGAQNNYTTIAHHEREKSGAQNFPYWSEWWKAKGIDFYMCIDLNGENDAQKWDLSEPLKTNLKFDLVCDLGTSEHVLSLYQAHANADKLCNVGGIIYHENPKIGNWPLHGHHFLTMDFYKQLAAVTGYEILLLEEHPAMGNTTDGWNIICVMRKTRAEFIKESEFPESFKS